jgi:hypothetical protein
MFIVQATGLAKVAKVVVDKIDWGVYDKHFYSLNVFN